MNREDIIRMAREAGFNVEQGYLLRITGIDEDIERFAALVAKHTLANIDPSSFMSWQEGYEAGKQTEREACAKLCEEYETNNDIAETWLNIVSEVIRARGDKHD